MRAKSPLPVRTITADHQAHEAIADLVEGLLAYEVWGTMAFHDIRQRFRRSVLGPFWLTLSMGILIATLGLVLSALLGQDIREMLPYIAVGLIFWGLLTGCINDGSNIFIGNESYIRNVPLPLSAHFYRMMARNIIIWVFNMAIYFVVLIFFRVKFDWQFLLFFPGFALFLLNAAWMGLAAGILSTRYRDIPQVIANIVQVVFYITPVFWSPATLPHRVAFVEMNPLYHVLELARAPLLGQGITLDNWLFAIGLAAIGLAFTAFLYRRDYARISYWV
jgi:ABC-type polysaccharide/polyol phosphate export permease